MSSDIETQKIKILSRLLRGHSLTALDVLKIGGGMKASTRLSELRNEDGWNDFIKREPVKVKNANGRTTTIMRYSI